MFVPQRHFANAERATGVAFKKKPHDEFRPDPVGAFLCRNAF